MGEAKRRQKLDPSFGKQKEPFTLGYPGGVATSTEQVQEAFQKFLSLRPWSNAEIQGFIKMSEIAKKQNIALNIHLFKDGIYFLLKDLKIGHGLELTSHMLEDITIGQWETQNIKINDQT